MKRPDSDLCTSMFRGGFLGKATVLLLWSLLSCSGVSREIPYEVAHLFTLGTTEAEVSYKERPTPTVAVNKSGDIAFPTRRYTICVFSPEGQCLREIIDSANVYPRDMLFDDRDVLQVLDYDGASVTKYPPTGQEPLELNSIEDWWGYSDVRIHQYLSEHQPQVFQVDKKGPLGEFLHFPYYLEIVVGCGNLLYVNGADLFVYDVAEGVENAIGHRCPGSLFGILNENVVLYRRLYEAYLYNLPENVISEIEFSDVEIHDSLPSGYHGNFPETNKRNLGMNWYWQRDTRNVYKVIQLSTGFRFFKITFKLESN